MCHGWLFTRCRGSEFRSSCLFNTRDWLREHLVCVFGDVGEVGDQKSVSGIFNSFLPLFLESRFLVVPGIIDCIGWLVSKLWRATCLCPPASVLIQHTIMHSFFMWVLGFQSNLNLNSSLHVYIASKLLVNWSVSPAPRKYFFFFFKKKKGN